MMQSVKLLIWVSENGIKKLCKIFAKERKKKQKTVVKKKPQKTKQKKKE